jgi:hypothetical protein
MEDIITALKQSIVEYAPLVSKIMEPEFSHKPSAAKWSKKEILGHLVDSAQNNIRRFIVGQYDDLPKIVYKQDDWVALTNYQQYPSDRLIELWVLINQHFCMILENMEPESSKRLCETNDPAQSGMAGCRLCQTPPPHAPGGHATRSLST